MGEKDFEAKLKLLETKKMSADETINQIEEIISKFRSEEIDKAEDELVEDEKIVNTEQAASTTTTVPQQPVAGGRRTRRRGSRRKRKVYTK